MHSEWTQAMLRIMACNEVALLLSNRLGKQKKLYFKVGTEVWDKIAIKLDVTVYKPDEYRTLQFLVNRAEINRG